MLWLQMEKEKFPFSFSALIEVRVLSFKIRWRVSPWGHCPEGFKTLPLGSSGDGFRGQFGAGDTVDWLVYTDPWRGREELKELSKAGPAILKKN
ncbi:hypothetical protein ACRRTK_015459 [Alexandromys fortis]